MAIFKQVKNWSGSDTGFLEKVQHESNVMTGVGSYEDLPDKPSINNVILQGSLSLNDLNIPSKDDCVLHNDVLTQIDLDSLKTKNQWYNAQAIDGLIITFDEGLESIEKEAERYTDSVAESLVAKKDKLSQVAVDVAKEDNQWYNAKAIDNMGLGFEQELEEIRKDIEAFPDQDDMDAFGKSLVDLIGTKVDKNKHVTVDLSDWDLTQQYDEDAWYNANMCNKIFIMFDGMLNDVEDKIPSDISELKNDKNYATVADVSNAVASLVGGAPETLNTLGELATGLASNKAVVEVLNDAIENKADKDHKHIEYLTEHQDLSAYATIALLEEKIAELEARIKALETPEVSE